MKARVVGRTIFLLPTREGERELLGRITHMTFEPNNVILTGEGNDTLTYLQDLRLHFQVAVDGIELAEATVET